MRRPRLLSSLLLAALLSGCSLFERPALETDFGAAYQILLGAPSAADGHPATPFLSADGQLHAVVEYVGGCADDAFRLDYTTAADEARLWIVHEGTDNCRVVQQEEVALPVNTAVRAQPRIVLVGPSGGAFVLRPAGTPGG